MRKVSDAGAQLVAKFEGCRSAAYKDAARVWTIGYGHTGYVKFYKKNVCAGMTITQEQAVELLKDDLADSEVAVNKYYSKYTWNQNEFDALVSFAFNIGSIDQLVANGIRSRSVISEKILLYNKAGGNVLTGLTTRRTAERALFLNPVTNIPVQTVTATVAENPSSIDTFQVKVTANSLRIRKGPGTNHSQTGSIRDKGVYTITETSNNWGCLKSGAGWICLDYTKRL
jgi:GH24 family phage-related lysozyme (muramidase)